MHINQSRVYRPLNHPRAVSEVPAGNPWKRNVDLILANMHMAQFAQVITYFKQVGELCPLNKSRKQAYTRQTRGDYIKIND